MSPPVHSTEDPEEDVYISEADSDFAPETAGARDNSDEDSLSSDVDHDDNSGHGPKVKRKRVDEAEDLDFENSGDEGVITKGLKRRKKSKKDKGGDSDDEEDDGGEGVGGFVRTRGMRAARQEEVKRAKAATSEGATIDVEAMWADMIKDPMRSASVLDSTTPLADGDVNMVDLPPIPVVNEGEMVTIQRTYNFAGKVHTETKVVHKASAEAKLFLAAQKEADAAASDTTPAESRAATPLRRPLARRSQFEPAVAMLPVRSDLRFKTATFVPVTRGKDAPVKKLNTVEKSKLDWAQYVDEAKLKEDLETAAKKKGTYLANQAFLNRAETRREEESRTQRLKGLVQ